MVDLRGLEPLTS